MGAETTARAVELNDDIGADVQPRDTGVGRHNTAIARPTHASPVFTEKC